MSRRMSITPIATFARSDRGGIELRIEIEHDDEGLRGALRLSVCVRTLSGWARERSISLHLDELDKLEASIVVARARLRELRARARQGSLTL